MKGTVPYNFVPLSDRVCYLTEDEADIRYDIPFEDGLTGVINYKITPQGPLFIRDMEEGFKFMNLGNRYFIPGTSLKGCIRNVLEIMSFSKMPKSLVENSKFGYRDFKNKRYAQNMKGKIMSGWMYKEGDNVYIDTDFETPCRIHASEIDKILQCGNTLYEFITKGIADKSDKNTEDRIDKKSTHYKIKLLEKATKDNINFKEGLEFSFDKKEVIVTDDKGELLTSYFLAEQGDSFSGEIVLTGQPGQRKEGNKSRNIKGSGKYLEFVFPLRNRCQYTRQDVTAIYSQFRDANLYSKDYEWRINEQFEKGAKIPVFFKSEHNNDRNILSIGMSYMYKYPYKYSVHDAIPKYDENNLDLTEAIFGYVKEVENNGEKQVKSLKGRVQFSPVFIEGEKLDDDNSVLASPHASYYPIYLLKGQNWNDEGIRVSGWKRYPIKDVKPDADDIIKVTDEEGPAYEAKLKGAQAIYPIECPAKAEYTGSIHFFNLRPFELGALLSALTFHGHTDCSHNIGMGKAYGYGKVKIKVESIDFPEWLGKDKWDGDKLKNEESKLLEAFESYVAKGISKEEDKLIDTEQWKELFAMAKGVEEKRADKFKYMELDDFKYVRNNSGKLQRFTKINDLKANQGRGGKVFVRHYPEWVTSNDRLCE